MRLIRLCLLIALTLKGLVAVTPAAAQPFDVISPPVPLPAFTLPALDGRGGSDADLRNKVTIIRFWASW
jgi:cytochrome oxidase Cu insertion factor (SCO1/SenC/PrrC family)